SPLSFMKPPLTQQSSRSPMRYRVAGLATGRDCSRIACTRVNMATFAPMPREIVRITVRANPGDLRNWRRASLKSYMGYGREDSGSVSSELCAGLLGMKKPLICGGALPGEGLELRALSQIVCRAKGWAAFEWLPLRDAISVAVADRRWSRALRCWRRAAPG